VDWTQAHHERGPQIYGVKEVYDYVMRRNSLLQTVVTAAVANRELLDGLAVEVQCPDFAEADVAIPPYTALLEWAEGGMLTVKLNFASFMFLLTDSLYAVAYLNSLKIAFVSTVLCLLLGYPMAYGIAKAPSS